MHAELTNGRASRPGHERPCWLEVDLDAVADNVQAIHRLIGPRSNVCAVVKADAYGLGAIEVGRAAVAAGADSLAVARVEEGTFLRRAGLAVPILLLAGFAPAEAAEIVEHRLSATIVQVDQALALGRVAGRTGTVAPVHVKVDTGLTRYGASAVEASNLVRLIQNLASLRLEGFYTHFAAADERDRSFTHEQLREFLSIVAKLELQDASGVAIHSANSAAALAEPAARMDMVRVGITLSGHYPSPHVPKVVGLRPAVALRASILRVYDVAPGASIGYGRTYSVARPTRTALVPVGYADGLPRAHSNRAVVSVRDNIAPIVGRVSMDQCLVDVTDSRTVEQGDVVTLFGPSTGLPVSLDDFAAWSDTIGHEALCRIGPRVPRLYRQAGRAWWGTADRAVPIVAAVS